MKTILTKIITKITSIFKQGTIIPIDPFNKYNDIDSLEDKVA